MRTTLLLLTIVALTGLVGLVSAQQPTNKAGQPPAKSGLPPEKSGTTQPPGKSDKPPEKMAPGKTSKPSNVETLVAFTIDGVRIEGDYYPAPEKTAKSSPCILLLHAVGPKHLGASRQDFGKLPEKLQKLGYAVAAIDLRGYGKSKSVESSFWNTHRARNRNQELIEGKDYASSAELMEMVFDLTAVKIWLNTKNNSKECNSHAIAVIGLEQSGLIAMAWAANEHSDPTRAKMRSSGTNLNGGFNNNGFGNQGGFNNQGGFGNNNFNNQGNAGLGNNNLGNQGAGNQRQPGSTVPRMEGEDIVTIIAISTTSRLNDAVGLVYLERWITYLRDHQTAIMAVYGAQDKEASAFWARAGLWARPAGDKFRFKNSGVKPVKGTSLAGAKLLNNDTLEVHKLLEDYLSESLKKAAESRLWAEQMGQDRPTPIDLQRLFR
jgi:hypothetical protein